MFTIATDAAPGRPNEDTVIATPNLAVVVDGAGIPFGGCLHGVAWYAKQLAARTVTSLSGGDHIPLQDGLAAAISAVAELHRSTCDLTSPATPCAAIGILRFNELTVETLALSDATVVVETVNEVDVTVDLAIEALGGTEPANLAGLEIGSHAHSAALAALIDRQTKTRNRHSGWWVAAADPAAAGHALTKSYPRQAVKRAAVFSDGATRPVDQMALYNWPNYLDLLGKIGPTELIARVREIEINDPLGQKFPRTKIHDDATIAVTQPDC